LHYSPHQVVMEGIALPAGVIYLRYPHGGRISGIFIGYYQVVGGIAYSWGFLFEVRGCTRPIVNVILAFGAAFALLFVPLTWAFGKPGAAAGIVAVCLGGLIAKQYYISRLRMGVSLFDIAKRAVGSATLASLVVLSIRRVVHPATSWISLVMELAIYTAVYALPLAWLERPLLREVVRALKERRADVAAVPAAGVG
ncbi:MAG: hypothetical protein ABJC09_14420, partial [Terriglobia bacterium]